MASQQPQKRRISLIDAGLRSPRALDRARLDSDVRAFLRQPSTPWITYDRASRASVVVTVEPSSMCVATDLESAASGETPVVQDTSPPAAPSRSRRAMLGVVAVLAAAAGVFGVAHPASAPVATATAAHSEPTRELAPPDLGAQLAMVEAKPAAPAAPVTGKLLVRGAARKAPVFVDGQRLAGTGARTVAIACGSHLIGVGAKSKSSRFDVPCGGEIVITR